MSAYGACSVGPCVSSIDACWGYSDQRALALKAHTPVTDNPGIAACHAAMQSRRWRRGAGAASRRRPQWCTSKTPSGGAAGASRELDAVRRPRPITLPNVWRQQQLAHAAGGKIEVSKRRGGWSRSSKSTAHEHRLAKLAIPVPGTSRQPQLQPLAAIHELSDHGVQWLALVGFPSCGKGLTTEGLPGQCESFCTFPSKLTLDLDGGCKHCLGGAADHTQGCSSRALRAMQKTCLRKFWKRVSLQLRLL